MIKAAAAATSTLLCAALLAGCGGDDEPEASGYVVVADISGSAAAIDLLGTARTVLADTVSSMEAPSTTTFLAFNMEVGSSACPPIEIDLEWSDNSTEVRDLRASYVDPAVAAVDPYVECSLKSFGGTGTDLFGGIAQAAKALDGVSGTRRIDVVTDGCHVAEGLNTCRPKVADAAWRRQALDGLNELLKPDLSGVELTFYGVGRGSKLQSAAVLGLKQLYTDYADLTGATVAFED